MAGKKRKETGPDMAMGKGMVIARGTERTAGFAVSSAGFAYVTVLLLITILTILSLSFLSRAGIGTSATLNRGFTIQAEYLAEAAVNHGMWRLINEPGFPPAQDKYYMHDLAGGRYGYMARRHTDSTFATLAAVGAIGESVVRRSYVMHLRASGASSQMATGTYVGDKTDNRAITDVGFRADVVIIKAAITKNAFIRTSGMADNLSKPLKGNGGVVPNIIKSLDTSGFTIGDNDNANKLNADYYWIAFRAVEGQMEVGSYIGDDSGAHDITGMCLTPALVIVFSEEGKEAVFRIDRSPDSFDFDKNGAENDCILSPFLVDGFRVGGDDRVNKAGKTYRYVCWPSIPGQQVSGAYTGNGNDDRDIVGLGLRPEYVLTRCVSNGNAMLHRPACLGSIDESLYFANKANNGNRIQALLADGFQIGSDNDVNDDGKDYVYFAWAKK